MDSKVGFDFSNKKANKSPESPFETSNKEVPQTEISEQIKTEPAKSERVDTSVTEKQADVETKNDVPYTDNRTVTISLVQQYSLYRKANERALNEKIEYIGSSFNSVNKLTASIQEMAVYMPPILGVSAKHETFVNRLKEYFSNIRVPVSKTGKTINTSFVYNSFEDYRLIKKKEDAIETEYQKADKSNLEKLQYALSVKIQKTHELEATKYAIGYPVDVEDYLLYRHCLLYPQVAKELSLINSTNDIRFYFKDDIKEAEKVKKQHEYKLAAKSNYLKVVNDPDMLRNIYILYCAHKGLSIQEAMTKEIYAMQIELDTFSINEYNKFNDIVNDKDYEIRATIEILISKGEFIRLNYNQNITTADGMFIGSNMNEAVAWFKNTDNISAATAYRNKIKTY